MTISVRGDGIKDGGFVEILIGQTRYPAAAIAVMPGLLQDAIDLIEEAHDTHIYSSNDEHPADCAYCSFIDDAKNVIRPLKKK